MAEGRIQVGVSDEYLDTTKITQDETGLKAHREAVFIADPTNPSAKATVEEDTGALRFLIVDPSDLDAQAKVGKNARAGDYGTVVHAAQMDKVVGLLMEMLVLQRQIFKLQEKAFSDGITGQSEGSF